MVPNAFRANLVRRGGGGRRRSALLQMASGELRLGKGNHFRVIEGGFFPPCREVGRVEFGANARNPSAGAIFRQGSPYASDRNGDDVGGGAAPAQSPRGRCYYQRKSTRNY